MRRGGVGRWPCGLRPRSFAGAGSGYQEILRGVPCSYGGVEGESTTPTGAAILKATVDSFAPPLNFTASAIGYGVGSRDFDLPNVLRVLIGELNGVANADARHCKIEANIDDMSRKPSSRSSITCSHWVPTMSISPPSS